MKRIKVFFGAILILAVLQVTQIPSYAQRPAVEGFIGVPWGASKAQVQAAMAKKGFVLQRADEALDTYRGTFADHPAELSFFYMKNVFHSAHAHLLDARSCNDISALFNMYEQMVELFVAKYGSPDREGFKNSYDVRFSTWENIPTMATPAGRVKIYINASKHPPWTGEKCQLWLSYSIGESWALLKSANDI